MVTVKNEFDSIDSWLEMERSFFSEEEVANFARAINLAEKYYLDHKFYPTNVNLLTHALTCAATVAELNLYADAVSATILFALPRFCKNWQEEVACFGGKVVELIDGVMRVTQIRKLGSLVDNVSGHNRKEQIEVIRKMLLSMASDIRVVLIVLVGRGELMLNLRSCSDEQMVHKIALETMEIFAPLANRLGLWQIKWELEDLSFKYLHPDQYKKIANLIDETREERLLYIDNIKEFISSQMEQSGITNYQVTGRAKHIYSIWKKMCKKGYGFDDLFDIRAVRVLVPEVRDCYTVLGIIHTKYSPIPGEFDDYISNPKANNYQSLHTCVIGPENKVVEIQIRTFAMHDHAEYGIAAHWRYKEVDEKSNSEAFAAKLAWLRQVLDWREELTDREDITDVFKNEVFSDTIYVMTPNGKVVALPKGSTPIDFAYHIHSDIGNRCRGAKIDGQIMPLSTSLKNGQHVEILTVKEGGPSINWLYEGFVKSSKAISHIRRYIRDLNNEEFIISGGEVLDRELSKFVASLRPGIVEVAGALGFDNEKNLAIAIGKGDISPNDLREALNKLASKADDEVHASNDLETDLTIDFVPAPKNNKNYGILVDGVAGIVTQMAKCCKPLPGDNIVGFVSQGKGVAIHRSNCHEIKRQAKLQPHKIMHVAWGKDAMQSQYYLDIEIIAHDRNGLLHDVVEFFAIEQVTIAGLKTITKGHKAYIMVTVKISSGDFDFLILVDRLLKIEGVIEAIRK